MLIVVPLVCVLLGVILASAAFCAYTKYRKSQGNAYFTVQIMQAVLIAKFHVWHTAEIVDSSLKWWLVQA